MEWISVKEKLPIKGERVLVTNGSSSYEAWLGLDGFWYRCGSKLVFMTPTHWMPMPDGFREG